MYRSIDEELTREAVRTVNRESNRVYNPVLTTGDVASHLDVDVATAFDHLVDATDQGYLSRKSVSADPEPEHWVWW